MKSKKKCPRKVTNCEESYAKLEALEKECYGKYSRCVKVLKKNKQLNKEVKEYINKKDERKVRDDIKAGGVGFFIGILITIILL